MTIEEARKVIEQMESQGASKEEIAAAFYLLFREDKIDSEQLEALVNLVGYELNDEFKNMDPEQQKENGYELTNDAEENVPTPPREGEEETDEASEEPEEDNEEERASKLFGEKTSNESKENDEDEEDDEEKKAMKLFGR